MDQMKDLKKISKRSQKDLKKIFISDGLKLMKFNEHTNHIDFEVRIHQNQIH